MTDRIIYGKKITLKCDDLVFTNTNPLQMQDLSVLTKITLPGPNIGAPSGVVFTSGAATPTSLTSDPAGTRPYISSTVSATGARVEPNAGEVKLMKMGHFVNFEYYPSSPMTVNTPAVASNRIFLLGAIPSGYRPLASEHRACVALVNGTQTMVNFVIATNGDITISAGLTVSDAFVITQGTAVINAVSFNYIA